MNSIARALVIGAVALAAAQAQAALVTWGINASYNSGATITGTVSFDDSTTVGLFDGSPDVNDTHVTADVVLTSSAFGWANTLFSATFFQPYYNSTYGDGPHFDTPFNYGANGDYVYLSDNSFTSTAFSNVAGTWSLNRDSSSVPEPDSLVLLGLGLLGLAANRKRKQA